MQDELEQVIRAHFWVEQLRIRDLSGRHFTHAEAQRHGGGHFSLFIVSPGFRGKSKIMRHRMVHRVLDDFFSHKLHALELTALTPEEYVVG